MSPNRILVFSIIGIYAYYFQAAAEWIFKNLLVLNAFYQFLWEAKESVHLIICARQYNFSGCFVCIYSFRPLTGTVWVCSFPLSQEHLLGEIANQQKHFKTGLSRKKVALAFNKPKFCQNTS